MKNGRIERGRRVSATLRIGTTKAISCAWMADKKEVSAVVVKAFKSFQMFPVPDGESGQSCGSWSWRGTSRVRGLISERSYPWAVEPAGPNGSIRPRLSGEGSGGEFECCLRWGSSWSDRRRHRRKTDACQVRNFKTASNIKWDCLRKCIWCRFS